MPRAVLCLTHLQAPHRCHLGEFDVFEKVTSGHPAGYRGCCHSAVVAHNPGSWQQRELNFSRIVDFTIQQEFVELAVNGLGSVHSVSIAIVAFYVFLVAAAYVLILSGRAGAAPPGSRGGPGISAICCSCRGERSSRCARTEACRSSRSCIHGSADGHGSAPTSSIGIWLDSGDNRDHSVRGVADWTSRIPISGRQRAKVCRSVNFCPPPPTSN